MKITFGAMLDGTVVGTRSSGTMAYQAVVIIGDADGNWTDLSWHLTFAAAYKATNATYVAARYPRRQVVPAVPIKLSGTVTPDSPHADVWMPLAEAATAYRAAEMTPHVIAGLAANVVSDPDVTLSDADAADMTAAALGDPVHAEPVDLDAEPVDVQEPIVTMSTDGNTEPVDGMARPIVKRTRENMAACAAVGLTYWSDHPRDSFVWAVDAHQTAHPVHIDRKHGTAAIGDWNLSTTSAPKRDVMRGSVYVPWSIDGPAQPDQTTIGGPAEAEFVPPVETVTAPRLGNLESVNHTITAADMMDALADSGKLIVGHIGAPVDTVDAEPVDAEPVSKRAYWEPANNGSGKRMWFICRRTGGRDQYPTLEYHTDRNGDLIRYSSCLHAQHAADRLNDIDVDTVDAEPVDVPAAPGLLPADARRTRLGDMVADALAAMVDNMSDDDSAALGGAEAVNAQLRAWLRRSGRVLVFKDVEPRTRRH